MQKTFLFLLLTTLTNQLFTQSDCSLYNPVCGINQITYQNPCLCQRAKIQISYYTACIQKTYVKLPVYKKVYKKVYQTTYDHYNNDLNIGMYDNVYDNPSYIGSKN